MFESIFLVQKFFLEILQMLAFPYNRYYSSHTVLLSKNRIKKQLRRFFYQEKHPSLLYCILSTLNSSEISIIKLRRRKQLSKLIIRAYFDSFIDTQSNKWHNWYIAKKLS